MTTKPLVGVLFGSESDRKVMEETGAALDRFEIPYEVTVVSAHRNPERTAKYAREARERGIRVIVAGAGLAAHLAGVIAAHTTLPVIAVPMPGSSLGGMDSLLSMVQMPGGVPVATVAIGKPGAKNAGILAAQILALADDALAARLAAFKDELASN